MRARYAAMMVIAAASLHACGGEEDEPAGENLVQAEAADAREQNTFELGGIDYRVVTFRQINPRIPSGAALYDGPPPEAGTGIFAAFIRACNRSDEPRTPTDLIDLEDAFGESYPQLEPASDAPFAYEPRRLRPDACLPRRGGATARAYSGAVILYRVPFDELGSRPFVLEFRAPGGDGTGLRRVALDL